MENMQCSDALVELTDLNRSMSVQCTPGTTTISSSSSIGSNRQSLPKYSPHFSCQGTSITSPLVHQHVKASAQPPTNQRYVAKIVSPRKAHEMPRMRMRPYFIPERSRTKSESLDTLSSVSTTYAEVGSGDDDDANGDCPTPANPYTTSTTNSATYSMVPATQMDTTNTSRSGLIQPQCNAYEDGQVFGTRKLRQRKLQALKKSRSMEDVRAEALDGSQLSHEMEFVSSRIQKLKVQE